MNNDELRPCPFCGSDKTRIFFNIGLEPEGIRCGNCKCIVRWPSIKVKGNHEPFGVAMSKMAEAWNRREKDETEQQPDNDG